MAAEIKDVTVEVSAEDQGNINRFACLASRKDELKKDMKEFKRQIENIEEASSELMLADDDEDFDDLGATAGAGDKVKDLSNLHFKIGGIFIPVTKDDCEAKLEKARLSFETKVAELKPKVAQIEEESMLLKAKLYAKFGNHIGLETTEED